MQDKKDIKSKVIIKSWVAKKLVRLGYQIIDLKPDKNDVKRTVFVFEGTDKFQKDLEKILFDEKVKREADEKMKDLEYKEAVKREVEARLKKEQEEKEKYSCQIF